MNGAQFITEVKVKLNRLDTSSYEDVRPEEVLYFGYEALKDLTLEFDNMRYKGLLSEAAILVYLDSLIKNQTELTLTDNKRALPDLFKLKDVEVYVEVDEEKGWQPTRVGDNNKTSKREYNPWTKSYPDMPVYRLIDSNILFDASDFICTKVRYDYLVYPSVIEESTDLDMTFISELQDKTVTLILENLESRRLQSQPVVSKS